MMMAVGRGAENADREGGGRRGGRTQRDRGGMYRM